jgi:hypothetical protein
LILDVGWYGESHADEDGKYIVHLIAEGNWQHPLARELAYSADELFRTVDAVVKRAEGLRAQ